MWPRRLLQAPGGALALALSWLSLAGVFVATDLKAAETATPSNRYLVVVETSRAMQRRQAGVADALRELIGSGMHGQKRPSDTLGLWTFDDELRSGRFPLQRWGQAADQEITEKVVSFIRDQTNDGPAKLDKVLPGIASLIRNSEFISVVLVTSGEEKLFGTPFDQQINRTFALWQKEQQRTHMPMLTFLRATRGQITAYAVGPAPWPLELPPLPPEFRSVITVSKPARTNATAAAPKPVKPAETVPPLIVVGKTPKPETTETPSSLPPPPVATPPAVEKVETPQPAVTAKAAVEEPAAVKDAATQTSARETKTVEPIQAAPVGPVAPTAPAPVVALPETPATKAAPATDVKPVSPVEPEPPKSTTVAGAPEPVNQKETTESSPAASAKVETPSTQTASAPETTSSSLSSPAMVSEPPDPPEPAVANGSPPVSTATVGNSVRLAAVALALVAFGLLVVMMRRARQPQKGSLITRSLERRSST